MNMKALTLTLAWLMSTMLLFAQKPVEIPLWPDGAPNDNGLEGIVIFDQQELAPQPTITVYPASQPNGMAIIMCPGGGYARLALGHEGHDMAAWFNAQGITYVVLTYRMPNGHKEVPLTDAEQAIRLVRQRANEWGINPRQVGIMGASAGGHLAASLANLYTSNETRPDFQILFYPVISMKPGITHQGSHDNLLGKNPSADLEDQYSLEKRVTDKTPQTFLMLSADDETVIPQNSIDYFMALKRHHVPASLHVYPTGGHGWGYGDGFPYKRQWTGELEKWLREGLQK